MLDILEEFLKSTVSPELYDDIEKANEVFEELNIGDSADEDYHATLMRDTIPDQTVTAIVDYTINTLDTVLEQHGVVVNKDNTSISLRSDFVRALLLIPEYENQSEILTVAKMDLDAEERFAELMALVLPFEAEEILYHLESVAGALVRKIIEQARTHDATPEIDPEERQIMNRLLNKLRAFDRFLKESGMPEDLFIVECVRDKGLPVNLNFLTYAGLVGRDFESIGEREAAANLLGMALVSFDGCDNPLLMVQKNIETFVSNMDKVTRISGFAAREIMSKFMAWESKQQ